MTYEDIVFAWNAQHVNNGPLVGDGRMWDAINDRERIEFVLRMRGEQESVDGGYCKRSNLTKRGYRTACAIRSLLRSRSPSPLQVLKKARTC